MGDLLLFGRSVQSGREKPIFAAKWLKIRSFAEKTAKFRPFRRNRPKKCLFFGRSSARLPRVNFYQG